MKYSPGRLLFVVGTLMFALPFGGSAQEFFRDFGTSRSSGGIGPVIPSEYTYEDGSPSGLAPLRPGQELTPVEVSEEEEKYNFALGPFRMTLAVGAGIEWNDNIRLSDENRDSDFVFRPTANVEARWRISELNTLRFNIQASYAKYFEHSELDSDGVLISPNSELAFTFFVGSIKFTIRDRFSYQEDTYDVPQLSGIAKYERYENQIGIQMDWQINEQLDLAAGYDHYNLWTTQDAFSSQDRAVDTIYIRPGFQLTPSLKVGLSAAYSWINFDDESERADGNNLMVGPFMELQISEYTNFYLEAGLQNMSYGDDSELNNSELRELGLSDEERDAIGDILRETDEDDTSTYYVKFELQNKPSEFFRHRLSGSKTAEVGFGSNFYDLYHIEYDAEWKITDKTEMGPILFYEYYETSGDEGEQAHRYGAAFGIRHHLSNSLTLGLDYRYLLKDSNLEGADYYQNLALLSIYYKF